MFSTSTQRWFPWFMLFARFFLFAIVQGLIAFVFFLAGNSDPWNEAARWWLFSVITTNLITIALLVRLFQAEGKRYLDIFHFERETVWKDLALAFVAFLLAAPIGAVPGNFLAGLLFGAAETPAAMMFQPLPQWAILIGLLFPLTIAFAELPTYFGYVMPRLEQQMGKSWPALALAAAGLSLQHVALPLIFDWRFILWRAFMFLPFAVYLALILKFRPRLLPYLAVCHFLIDLLALSTYTM
ncbi:MAG: hypothetical protein AB1522_03035 [Chloroflexota bacterium]